MPADDEIISLARAGRAEEAFDRLVPAYRRRVVGLAYGILRDRVAAEDLAQEVFVRLWRALPNYDGRAQLSTWIYAITRNAAISALRARKRTVSMSDAAVQQEAEGIAAQPDPAAGADAVLWRHVDTLPEKQRRAVILYYQDERTVEEVAAMMGLPVNTVKTHLHRARARLAAALGAGGQESA